MARTNFQIFNEENAPERTYNDSEYREASQRVGGVMPGMALSRMHNKMYYQWSAMCKAIANLVVNNGYDCMDNDVEGITRSLGETITGAAAGGIRAHRTASVLDHPDGSVTTAKLADGAVTREKLSDSVGKEFRRTGSQNISGNVDWNTLTEPTTYKINDCTMTEACHAPDGEYRFGLLVVHRLEDGKDHENRTIQIYYPHTEDGFWTRMHNGRGDYEYHPESWTAWRKTSTDWVHEKGFLKKTGGTVTGDLSANTFYSDDWFRAKGSSGFYFQDHGGGFNMTDDMWIRTFGGKPFYCDTRVRSPHIDVHNNGALHFMIEEDVKKSMWIDRGNEQVKLDGVLCATHFVAGTHIDAPRYYADDWYRCRGNAGLLFEKHGGGWYMQDSDWIRAWNSKGIYTSGAIKADGGFRGKADTAGWADSAANADSSNVAQHVANDGANMRFHWNGQGGQPAWLWGGNNPNDMYVYNPSNFRVANADTVGDRPLGWILDQINAAKTGIVAGSLTQNGWVKFANGLIVQWGIGPSKGWTEELTPVTFPVTFPAAVFVVLVSTDCSSEKQYESDMMWQVYSKSNSGAVLYNQGFTNTRNTVTPEYIAIGI